MSANFKLEALRSQIRALEGHSLETPEEGLRVLPFADERLNAPLPRGGLRLGAFHEFCANGLEGELAPAVTAFAATVAASILRRPEGSVLWAASQADCYPPGLVRLGLNPSRIVWIDCSKDAEVLSVMEEALHSRALAAVLGEAGTLSLKTGRRLDAAARQSGTPALLLRRHRSKPSKMSEGPSGAAATRWRVSAVPVSGTVEEPGLALPRWRLDLEYCRNGRTASWIVETSDGADGDKCKAGHVRVVAELRDDARPLEAAPARSAARTARSA
ncbi:MAG: protein imuA [Rhodomicrobium sp.]|nr:protein imuA [Rhodomicrobium sp.]